MCLASKCENYRHYPYVILALKAIFWGNDLNDFLHLLYILVNEADFLLMVLKNLICICFIFFYPDPWIHWLSKDSSVLLRFIPGLYFVCLKFLKRHQWGTVSASTFRTLFWILSLNVLTGKMKQLLKQKKSMLQS